MNPVSWWHDLQGGKIAEQRPPPPGADQPYPNLATVPPKPAEPDRAALANIANALIADRTNAQHIAAAAPIADPSSPSASPALFGSGTVPPPPPPPPPAPAGERDAAGGGSAAGATRAARTAPAPPPAASDRAAAAARRPPRRRSARCRARRSRRPAPTAQPPAVAAAAPPPLPAAPPPPPNLPAMPRAPSRPPPTVGRRRRSAPPASCDRPAAADPAPAAAGAGSASGRSPANTVSVTFVSGSAALPPTAADTLKQLAARRGNGIIAVTGYGDAASNDPDAQSAALTLGLSRAQAMAAALTSAGVPATAVQVDAEAIGRGGTARLVQYDRSIREDLA